MAIGAESTGWMVQVDSETIIDGKPISSIEVSDIRKPKQLEELDNKRVKIAGKVLYRHGVETGVQPYVEITTIKAVHRTETNPKLNLVGYTPNQWFAFWPPLSSPVLSPGTRSSTIWFFAMARS